MVHALNAKPQLPAAAEDVGNAGDHSGGSAGTALIHSTESRLSARRATPRPSAGNRLYTVIVKRGVDMLASVLLLMVLSPLMAAATIAVRLDSAGPVLFTQQRVGRYGREFRLYKFRTMGYEAEAGLRWLTDDTGRQVHKVPDDPRVTRAGRWLRRTSIDELPQLINVIRGEMSLIGPRPELPEIAVRYEPWQHERHLVRPGITGWWQVSGRSQLPMHENTELDLYYVRNQSLRLDLLIAIRTFWVVIRGLGAF